jgi:hypothetical protein
MRLNYNHSAAAAYVERYELLIHKCISVEVQLRERRHMWITTIKETPLASNFAHGNGVLRKKSALCVCDDCET